MAAGPVLPDQGRVSSPTERWKSRSRRDRGGASSQPGRRCCWHCPVVPLGRVRDPTVFGEMDVEERQGPALEELRDTVRAEVGKVVIGYESAVDLLLTAAVAGGPVL